MKEKKTYFWKALRCNTIFSRIFYGLLLLSLSVLTIFYIFINILSARHHKEQLAFSNLNLISQAASSMDITLDALAQGMRLMLWNRDFMEYMINPRPDNGPLIYRISLQLHNSVTGSPLVKKAVFIASLSDTVIQDSSQLSTCGSYGDRVLMESRYQPHSGVYNEQSRTRTSILYYKNRLFLIQELNIASPIGTLIYELDLQALQKQFFNLSDNQNHILVLDSQGISVFSSEKSNIDLEDASAFLTYENLSVRAASQNSGYYRYTATSSGWNFLLPIDSGSLVLPMGQILTLYMPVFMIIFLFSLFFAWFVGRTTYRPINHLMQLVNQPDIDRSSKINEADFLESVYFTALDSKAKMEGIVNSIAPEIIESMLKSLVMGRALSEERISEILGGVGNPIRSKGRFYVIACTITPSKGREVNDTELNLHLLTIRNVLGKLQTLTCRLYDIRTEKQTLALVCCFLEDQTIGDITQAYHRIKRVLQSNTELLPFQVQLECGNVYENLCDIGISYLEAIKRIQHMQCIQPDFLGEMPEPEPVVTAELDQRYFNDQAKAVVKLAADNLWPQAQAKLMCVLEEITDKATSQAEYMALIQKLMNETLELVMLYPLTKEDQLVLNRCRTRLETIDLGQKQDVVRMIQEDYQMIFKMVAACSHKNRYKYIEAAKTYIAENYMDSNLSLNMVSDYVGISAPYLSELFNEIVNEKFSAYLAAFRVEKARQLFYSTKLTSKEISIKCGFNSVQNFIRVFKKFTGHTPGRYREEIGTKEGCCTLNRRQPDRSRQLFKVL